MISRLFWEKHIHEQSSEISANEGQGALNFLDLDDRTISSEGSVVDPDTIYQYPVNLDLPVLPAVDTLEGKEFVDALRAHPSLWAVIIGDRGIPQLVLNTTQYLSQLFARGDDVDIYDYCHRPIVVSDHETTLDDVLGDFVVEASDQNDHVVDRDVILYWADEEKRIVTGADIFGQLLRGIARA